MDEGKKSESSWEEAEKVGPYRLEEQVPQDDYSQGECYRATHETSGAPALVRKRATEDEQEEAQQTDLRVRLISSAAHGYDAMEVEQTPMSVAPDRQSVESLVSTLEEAHKVVERMAHAVSASDEPRPRRRLGLALTSAATVCALAFTLVFLASKTQPQSSTDALVVTEPARPSHEVPTDNWEPLTEVSLLGTTDGGLLALARPMPSKPYPGQRRPPCVPRAEVEINGGCWVPHAEKAPCPESLFEHQDKCYTVSGQPAPMPQSLGQ
ncbi:hypothetical protein [Archangium sp.]|uniref:hypothetical protein n=1 Tax=Archangium sp. TaxID=1872627 RepID=UPI00286B63DD|nr:hypothetical protein [Archangium sp.]